MPGRGHIIPLNARKGSYHTLEVLEVGCGLIASMVHGARSDMSDLQQECPNLVPEYEPFYVELRFAR